MSLIINIKSSDVLKEAKEKIKAKLEEDLKKAIQTLSSGAAKQAEKLAKEKLPKSLSSMYTENIYVEQLSENMMVVGLREKALWIEEGRKGGFMEELLTKKSGSDVKTDKDGNKYRVIPFEHSATGKDMSSTGGEDLVKELKTFLRKKGVNYSKTRGLELDDKGSPRIGKTHSFSIKDMHNKKKGVSELSPNLQGISIFQNMNKKTGKIERNIMTFRVISEKHRGSKWNHPGRPGENILEEAHKWAEETWRNTILPELKKKYE